MASSYIELYRKLSAKMQSDAVEIGVYDHPTAKGDGREDLVCNLLKERIGTTFGVSKAEVVDANGATTGEFDCAIYDQSVASSLHVMGNRRVVRVETLAMVIEVKSKLEAHHVDEYTNDGKGLDGLRRFYEPAPLLSLILNNTPEMRKEAADKMFEEGLPMCSRFEDVPAVIHGFFAFNGPEMETAAQYMRPPGVDIICVLNKYTIAKPDLGASLNVKHPVFWGKGEDALGAFLQCIEHTLQKFRISRELVWPAPLKYFKPTP